MYFWNITQLAKKLKREAISFFDFCLYSVFLFFLCAFGLSTINFLANFYFLVFTAIKTYLEKQAAPAPLTIHVYNLQADFFIITNILIIIIGFFYSFLMHTESLKQFIIRCIALSCSLILRITLVTGIIFAIICLAFGLYFGYKLMILTKIAAPKGPIWLQPLKYFFKITKTYSAAKAIWAQAHNFMKAQIIFNQINKVSYYSYWTCQLGSVGSTLWWMLTLQEKIRLINKE